MPDMPKTNAERADEYYLDHLAATIRRLRDAVNRAEEIGASLEFPRRNEYVHAARRMLREVLSALATSGLAALMADAVEAQRIAAEPDEAGA